MACQEQAVFRPSYSPVYSLLWEASFVHNTQFTIHLCPVADRTGPLNNPVPVSLLSGDRKPQIRFLGNHPSGSGNLYHKSFRM